MKKNILFLLMNMLFGLAIAQKKNNTLHAEEFLQIVRVYHPVAKLAKINVEQATADVLQAKAAFNPIISNYITKKTIDNTNYYDYTNSKITLPTWYGIELSAGIENLSGNRYDPSETLGKTSYVGIQVPLLKNLWIDKRRAFLKQAKIYKEMATTEQQIAINDLLKEAVSCYWEWVYSFLSYEIKSKNYATSKKRFDFIKKMVFNGERPAIDTIEALSQLQNIEYQKNEQYLEYQNKRLEISTYLWNQNNTPYLLPENVEPQLDWDNEINLQKYNLKLEDLLKFANELHPELMFYNQKNKVLQIDKKLKIQELLPKLDLTFNQINKGQQIINPNSIMLDNNSQYGIKFEMPLFLSNGRASYKQAKLKLLENEIELNQKKQFVEQKVKIYHNQYQNLKTQMDLQKKMLLNNIRLLNAEEILFQNGESSLFLINNRENKVLETENKYVETKTKYLKSIYYLQWAAGILQ